MSKYIDAHKLKAEIESRRKICADIAADERNEEVAEYYRGKEVACDEISSLVTSLQQEQPEVDLEKEMEEYFKGWTETDEGIACHYQYVDLNTCRGIAHHFYELGLNARKEK